jgi:hypothetical protein
MGGEEPIHHRDTKNTEKSMRNYLKLKKADLPQRHRGKASATD